MTELDIVLGIFFLIPTILTGLGSIFAPAAGAGIFSGLTGFFIKAGLALGLNALANSIFRPEREENPVEQQSGIEVNTQYGGDVPRSVLFGKCMTRGHLVYDNIYEGEDGQDRWDQVFVVGDGWNGTLEGFITDGQGKQLDILTPEGNETQRFRVVGGYNGNFELKYYDGRPGQEADAALISSSNPAGRWTADCRLTGMAYVIVSLRYDRDTWEEQGLPNRNTFKFIVNGHRMYDPRFDDTNGGAGPQRWDDQSTWGGWSGNPAIQLYNALRGIFVSGTDERIFGLRLEAGDIDNDTFFSAMSACEEQVSLAAGGTEERYLSAMAGDDSQSFSVFVQKCVDACAGFTVNRSGKLGLIAGVAQPVVATINADGAGFGSDEVTIGTEVVFNGGRSRSDLANAVRGQWRDPQGLWEPTDYPPIVSDFYADKDGEPIYRTYDLTQVQSVTRAQRIAKIRLLELRYESQMTITVGFDWVTLDAGDWIVVTSTRFPTLTWRVADRIINSGDNRSVTLVLDEIGSAAYDWNTSEEGPLPAQPIPSDPTPRVSDVTGLQLIQSANDGTLLEARYDPILDPTIIQVQFERREVNTDNRIPIIDPSPEDGRCLVLNADPAKDYEIRAKAIASPARATNWTAWVKERTSYVNVKNSVHNALLESPGVAAPVDTATEIPHWFFKFDTYTQVEIIEPTDPQIPPGPPPVTSPVIKFTPTSGGDRLIYTEADPADANSEGLGYPVFVGQEVVTYFDVTTDSATVESLEIRLVVRPFGGGAPVEQVNKRAAPSTEGRMYAWDQNWGDPAPNPGPSFNRHTWEIVTDGEAFLEIGSAGTGQGGAWFLNNFQVYVRDFDFMVAERAITDKVANYIASGPPNDITGTGIGSGFFNAINVTMTATIPADQEAFLEAEAEFIMTGNGDFEGYVDIESDVEWFQGATGISSGQQVKLAGNTEVTGTGKEETYTATLFWQADAGVTLIQRNLRLKKVAH